jgi:hypothetical protein
MPAGTRGSCMASPAANHSDPLHADDHDLIRAIPVAITRQHRLAGSRETVAGLRDGVITGCQPPLRPAVVPWRPGRRILLRRRGDDWFSAAPGAR